MRQMHPTAGEEKTEKVLLVGREARSAGREGQAEALEELARLAETAGLEVLGRITQPKGRIDGRTYVGSGKVEEIAERAKSLGATLVIFDDDLTPAQGRNLDKALGVHVLDRSELILNIFALRAKTAVARTQVELAQLEYQLPRLTRLWTHLSRPGGGIGTRGPGETQLEVDRRRIRERIQRLKDQLEKVEEDRRVQRRSRKEALAACLVGYTNAGKSSLFNRLTSAGVLEEDRLFATVDSTSRVLELPEGRQLVLSDTVGFIRKIPHSLVASFHATLEEAVEADLLLHVLDAADPEAEEHARVVEGVLSDIGCRPSAQVLVLNKIDRTDARALGRYLARRGQDVVAVSALTGEGIGELRSRIQGFVESFEVVGEVRFPIQDDGVRAFLHRHGRVVSERFGGRWTHVRIRMQPRYFEVLRKRGVSISFDGEGPVP